MEVAVAAIWLSSAAACACACLIWAWSETICSSSVRRRAAKSARSRARCSAASRRQIVGHGKARLERRFRPGARLADALRAELPLQHTQLGAAPHVADDHQRIAGAHRLAVTHQDLAHDAAFLVLDRLAVELDLDLRRRDDRTGERRRRRPEPAERQDDGERQDRPQRLSPKLDARGGCEAVACEESGERRRIVGFHACASAGAGLPTVASRGVCWAPARSRGKSSAVGPNASSAPSFRTASLSSCDTTAGR